MPPKLEIDPGSELPKVEVKKYPRLRRVGVYIAKTACLGFMIGAGVFGAIELQEDDFTGDIAEKGAVEIEPAIGEHLEPAVETATGDIKTTLIDEVDTAVEEVQVDIESHIDAEVDTLKNELYLILVDQGFLQIEDLSVVMGGACPHIRTDCIGQG